MKKGRRTYLLGNKKYSTIVHSIELTELLLSNYLVVKINVDWKIFPWHTLYILRY